MSFLRHWEIFRSDELAVGGATDWLPLPAHRLDEFPVGYSWRVALQQSPLPLRQLRRIVRGTVFSGKNFL